MFGLLQGGILDSRFFNLDQPVLVECSKLCRCWSFCGNRVVQKGIQFPLEVFKTASIGRSDSCTDTLHKPGLAAIYVAGEQ